MAICDLSAEQDVSPEKLMWLFKWMTYCIYSYTWFKKLLQIVNDS